jgi:hypothetical protein
MNLRRRYPHIKSPQDLFYYEASFGDIERLLINPIAASAETEPEQSTALKLGEPLANPVDAQRSPDEAPSPGTPAIPLRDDDTFEHSIQLSLQVSEEEHYNHQLQEAFRQSLL